jgi:invasion protein IalB
LVAFVAVAAMCTGATEAQQPPADAPAVGAAASQPPSWSVGCTAAERASALNCAVQQNVFLTATGQMIGSIAVRVPGDTKAPVMTITTPIGLFLPAGVSIAIDDGAAQNLVVQTCDAHGCYAELALSDDLLARLFKGVKLNVVFQDLTKRTITLPLSLTGFTAAYAKIK